MNKALTIKTVKSASNHIKARREEEILEACRYAFLPNAATPRPIPKPLPIAWA